MRMPRFMALFPIVCGLTACDALSPPAPKQYTWTEDVTLDSSSIRVRRVVAISESNSWSGDAHSVVETGSRIEFMDALASLPQWTETLRPIVLYRDMDTSEWVVVASTSSCDVWRQAGKPKPPYWEYRLREHHWERVPLSETSLGRRANLAQSYRAVAGAGHLTPELRAQLDSPAGRFRTFRAVNPDPNQAFCGEGYSSKP
ncbi:hypothetical protein [Steroidobacter cummioxidans]|uniref:hypothetical protein n=1 Tax=Steroidobacter cummioxidans TaxID=1803913 RepID=UPI000E31218C|nr:hypothetical protein [Steroidobacter cummioxidans]